MTNEIPADLALAFRVSDALDRGVPYAHLRRGDLDRPFHGVRSRDAERGEDDRTRILRQVVAFATRMTDAEFFSHSTAAMLWGLPLPYALERRVDVDVAVLTPHRNPRGRGIRGHEIAPHLAHVTTHPVLGVRLASPASTWAMLGAGIHDPYALVAAGDAVTRLPQHPDDPPALATIGHLEAAIHAGRRVGINALRAALPRVRVGASSPGETCTRLILIDRGLPEPELAFEVFDERGEFIGRVDLAYPRYRVAIEYEGEHHLTDPEQWNRDIRRYERLAAAGWHVVRVTKRDLRDEPHALARRVRAALVQRGA